MYGISDELITSIAEFSDRTKRYLEENGISQVKGMSRFSYLLVISSDIVRLTLNITQHEWELVR